MLFRILFAAASLGLGLTQTTSVPPTWGQIYYEQAPYNPRFDYATPLGKHDNFAQPVAPSGKPRVKNLILVIRDGFGPASEVSLVRSV